MQKVSASILISLYVVVLIISTYFCGIAISYPKKYESIIEEVCAEFNISQSIVYSLINTESSFDSNAKSSAGAIGLTQLLPSTAEYICIKNNIDYSTINLYNINDNIYIGTMYLKYLINKFNTIYTALAAYNAGETTVRTWLKDSRYSYDQISLYNIPYKETSNYIKKIKNSEKIYRKFYNIKN